MIVTHSHHQYDPEIAITVSLKSVLTTNLNDLHQSTCISEVFRQPRYNPQHDNLAHIIEFDMAAAAVVKTICIAEINELTFVK